MEDLLSSKVYLNPVRDVWSVEEPLPTDEKIYEGRVLVVSHYLPVSVRVSSEDSGNASIGSRRSSLAALDRGNGGGLVPNPEQVQAHLSGNYAAGSTNLGSNGISSRSDSVFGVSPTHSGSVHVGTAAAGGGPGGIATSPSSSGSGILLGEFGKRESLGSIPSLIGRSAGYVWSFRQSQNGNIGLFNAINSMEDRMERVYIGECETEVPRVLQDEISEELLKLDCVPVFTTASEANGHYTSFCKQVLWPMFHYIVPNFEKGYNIKDKSWKDYCTVNQKFADVIVANYRPGDFVWVHDYHLILVPQMVRKRLPNAAIGFFLHIPFPSSEIFRCLHVRNELLDGMLGANVVGFQTYSFSRHFLHTCSRLRGVDTTPSSVQLDNTVVYVGIFPIGINMAALQLKRQAREVAEHAETLRQRYHDKKILIGREKLDNIKGVPNKLLAFEMFLSEHPEWVGKVVLIQVAMIGSANKDLHTQVFDIVSRINGRFGSLEYSPVVYLHQNIPFHQYLALLSIADVCLITSLRDGMNLTSHEYVVCQSENHSPLILSEFAGTYGSLGGAIRVNPWDYRQVAQSIHEALTMPEEDRVSRHQELLKYVSIHTAQFWVESFVRQVVKMSAFNPCAPHHDVDQISRSYKVSRRRLILLGYDGTLSPIRRRPELALPSQGVLETLKKLAANPHNVVCVLTGRQKSLTERWLSSVPGLYISAEAGCFLKRNGDQWTKLLSDTDVTWRNEVLDVLEYYTERTEGSEIEQKDFSFTWHYRNAEPIYGDWQAKECYNHLTEIIADKYPIITMHGNKTIEIQPINVNKVTVVRHLLSKVLPDPDFILCVGSDKYDDAVYEFLGTPGALASSPTIETVSVGSKSIKAQGFLPNSNQAADFLSDLARL